MKKNRRNNFSLEVYFLVIIVILALVGLLWFFSKSFLQIKVKPVDVILSVDNKEAKIGKDGVAKFILVPGEHIIKAEGQGYIGTTKSINLKRSRKLKLSVQLLPIVEPESIANVEPIAEKDFNNFNTYLFLGNDGKTIYKTKLTIEDSKIKSFTVPITDSKLDSIEEIIWSPNKELALFRKNNNITLFDFKKYDFINQTETDWGKNIGNIAWSPDNSKIAYFYSIPGKEKSLIFSNISNSEILRVLNFNEYELDNPILRWSPDSETLLIIPRGEDKSKNKIYAFDISSRTLNELTETGYQLDAKFSPDGNKILYTSYSKEPGTSISSIMSLMNKDGSEKKTTNIRVDLSDVAWQKDSQNILISEHEDGANNFYTYNVEKKKKLGFSVRLRGGSLSFLDLSDDGKILVYQADNKFYALPVQ